MSLDLLRCAYCGDAVEGSRVIHLHPQGLEAYYFCSAEPDEMSRGASCHQKWRRGALAALETPSS